MHKVTSVTTCISSTDYLQKGITLPSTLVSLNHELFWPDFVAVCLFNALHKRNIILSEAFRQFCNQKRSLEKAHTSKLS